MDDILTPNIDNYQWNRRVYIYYKYCVDVMVQLLSEVDGIGGFASIDAEKEIYENIFACLQLNSKDTWSPVHLCFTNIIQPNYALNGFNSLAFCKYKFNTNWMNYQRF